MKNLLKLDLIGSIPTISIKSRPNFQSYFGTFLTFMIFLISLYSTYSPFSMFLNKTFPQISYDYAQSNQSVYLNNNFTDSFSMPYLINIATISPPSPVPKFNNVNMDNLTWPYFDYLDEKIANEVSTVNLEYKENLLYPCNISELKAKIKLLKDEDYQFWEDYLYYAQFSYCANPNNQYLYSSLNSRSQGRLVSLNIKKNSLSPNALSYTVLNIVYPKYYISPSNNGKSYIKHINMMTFPLDYKKLSIYNVFFENTTTISDFSEMFSSNIVTKTFISLDSYQQIAQYDTSNIEGYDTSMIILFHNPKINTLVKLKYYSLSNVLSSLGGSFSLYFMMVKYIYRFLSKFNYIAYLLNSIFKYHNLQEENQEDIEKVKVFKRKTAYYLRQSVIRPNGEDQNKNKNESHRKLKTQDLDEFKSQLHKNILDIFKKKTEYRIKPKDVIHSYLSSIICKNPTGKDKIIRVSQEIISNKLDFISIVKTTLDLTILKSCYIDEGLMKYLSIPSLNIKKENETINYIEKFKEPFGVKSIKDEELRELVTKDLSKKKYSLIVNNLIDFYDEKEMEKLKD